MSTRDVEDGITWSDEEAAAAERLATALEGRPAPDVDREALDAAQMLQALAPQAASVRSRRTRMELLDRAASARRSAYFRRTAQAVAALFVVATLTGVLWRGAVHSTSRKLAQRELEAAQAVASISSGWSPESAQAARLGSAFDDHWRERLAAKVAGERAALVVKQGSTSSTPGADDAGTTLEGGRS